MIISHYLYTGYLIDESFIYLFCLFVNLSKFSPKCIFCYNLLTNYEKVNIFFFVKATIMDD